MSFIGSCVQTCTSLSICTNLDLNNKQGPICYVGQFGVSAKAVACLSNQFCEVTYFKKTNDKINKLETHFFKRKTVSNLILGQYSFGNCVSTCTSNATTYCCNTDLCNAFHLSNTLVSSNERFLKSGILTLLIIFSFLFSFFF